MTSPGRPPVERANPPIGTRNRPPTAGARTTVDRRRVDRPHIRSVGRRRDRARRRRVGQRACGCSARVALPPPVTGSSVMLTMSTSRRCSQSSAGRTSARGERAAYWRSAPENVRVARDPAREKTRRVERMSGRARAGPPGFCAIRESARQHGHGQRILGLSPPSGYRSTSRKLFSAASSAATR